MSLPGGSGAKIGLLRSLFTYTPKFHLAFTVPKFKGKWRPLIDELFRSRR